MTPSELVVGVDIGTSVVKAVALDETGAQRGSAQHPTSWNRPSGERAEIGAETVVADVLACVGALLEELAGSLGRPPVRGLGLAGLGESGFLLDRHGRPVAPAFAWFDPRGAQEVGALDAGFRREFPARTGLRVSAQCSLAKLLWLRGAGYAAASGACWLNVPEYVAVALGGARVTEPSLASRTGLLDQDTVTAWPAALAAAGLPADVLPPTVPAGEPCGAVTSDAVPGQLRGAVITVAGHDHCVAAVGSGAVASHQLFNSYGTADVLLRSVAGGIAADQRRALVDSGVDAVRHVLPGRSALVTGTRGGLLLQRTLELLRTTDRAARTALDASLPEARAGLPSPVATVDLAADGSLEVTTSDGASPTDVWQAALARVTVEAARRTAAVERVVGPRDTALAAGGWTALRGVRAARRRAVPGITFGTDVTEPGATGAALLAARAAGGTPETPYETSNKETIRG